jgi:sec-independent protein translocase protein TatA
VVHPTPIFAFLDGVGGPEMFVIFALSLMLFGGKKLPEVARGLGKAVREFKRAAAGVEDEIRRAIDTAPPSTPSPANRPRPPVATPAPTAISRPLDQLEPEPPTDSAPPAP